MANLLLGQYINKKTFLHNLDPRTKLLSTFGLMIGLLFIDTIWGYIFACVVVTLLIIISKISILEIIKSFKNIIYILLFSCIFHVFFTSGENIVLKIGNIYIYDSGIYSAIEMIIKIILLLAVTTLLTLTTKPFEISLGLETLLSPLKKIKMPIQEFSLMVSITLRFIPTILNEVNTIIQAQRARGAEFEERNIFKRIYNYSLIIVPLLVSTLNRCDNLTLAIEARAYNCGIDRVNFRKLKYNLTDYFYLISLMVIVVIFVLL